MKKYILGFIGAILISGCAISTNVEDTNLGDQNIQMMLGEHASLTGKRKTEISKVSSYIEKCEDSLPKNTCYHDLNIKHISLPSLNLGEDKSLVEKPLQVTFVFKDNTSNSMSRITQLIGLCPTLTEASFVSSVETEYNDKISITTKFVENSVVKDYEVRKNMYREGIDYNIKSCYSKDMEDKVILYSDIEKRISSLEKGAE